MIRPASSADRGAVEQIVHDAYAIYFPRSASHRARWWTTTAPIAEGEAWVLTEAGSSVCWS